MDLIIRIIHKAPIHLIWPISVLLKSTLQKNSFITKFFLGPKKLDNKVNYLAALEIFIFVQNVACRLDDLMDRWASNSSARKLKKIILVDTCN